MYLLNLNWPRFKYISFIFFKVLLQYHLILIAIVIILNINLITNQQNYYDKTPKAIS